MSWRRLGRSALVAAGVFVLVCAYVQLWGVLSVPASRADAIVVMGCPPNEDGTASDCLIRRVDRGVALWKEGRAPSLVVTGGELHGLEAEARVAARRALADGVDGEALVVEPFSANTWENARNTVAIARVRSVIVVTDEAHALRATRCFAAQGVVATASGVREGLPSRIVSAVREVFALADYGLLGRFASPKRPPSEPPT